MRRFSLLFAKAAEDNAAIMINANKNFSAMDEKDGCSGDLLYSVQYEERMFKLQIILIILNGAFESK